MDFHIMGADPRGLHWPLHAWVQTVVEKDDGTIEQKLAQFLLTIATKGV